MDLVSASTERLAALPHSTGETEVGNWLEELKERADRFGGCDALFTMGQYYFSRGLYEECLSYFQRAEEATPSSSSARYQLGVMYYDGLGVTADLARGFQYMSQVASSPAKKDCHLLASAQYNVGRAYFMGFGVAQSDTEAEKWWRLAGSHGSEPSSVRAQSTLGMFYSRPESLDLDKAYHWTSTAADNGHNESMASLGLMYLCGHHGNYEKALKWLRQSSEEGCVYGTGLLARLYLTRKLFSKAAETAFKVSELELGEGSSVLDCRGVAIGCFILARCLQLGQAVAMSQDKALHYYTKATQLDKQVVADLHDQLTHGKV